MTKILIIDDERSIRNSMKDILSFEGYEVVTAPDVVIAQVKLTRAARAAAQQQGK